MNKLFISESRRYELIYHNAELVLGPFIGILLPSSEKWVNGIEGKLKRYIHHFDQVGGTIKAFSLSGVDQEKSTVKGYLYDPDKGDWIRGIYPQPGAVFSRVSLNEKWRIYFESLIGKKIFNNYRFTKWDMYEWLQT
ncbi:hypothetical protein ACOI1C_10405 [Bacillus sp. DJP31]|uniref:hypothetical protein n=1 Tax=Bacillus sp. DJP31 TaxID=3409789 RepID=UPI003BB49EBA